MGERDEQVEELTADVAELRKLCQEQAEALADARRESPR
jgi:DNA repair ATPase RecN